MAIVKWKNRDLYDPWKDFKTLQDEINDLFDFNHSASNTGLFDHSFSPSMDVVEDEKEFRLQCELPGMDEKDIDISLASNVLTIKGKKMEKSEGTKGKIFKKQIVTGSFQRTLSLPPSVSGEGISASLKNGLLTVVMPKSPEAQPRSIDVKVK